MKRFTVILEFRGGTYIKQVYADYVSNAIVEWAESLVLSDIKYLGHSGKKQLISIVKEYEPVQIEGMDNVWCRSGTLRSGFFIANIVAS